MLVFLNKTQKKGSSVVYGIPMAISKSDMIVSWDTPMTTNHYHVSVGVVERHYTKWTMLTVIGFSDYNLILQLVENYLIAAPTSGQNWKECFNHSWSH